MTELAGLTSRICVVCWKVFRVGVEDFYDPQSLEWQRYMPTHCLQDTVPCPTFEGSTERDRGKQTAFWVKGRPDALALMQAHRNDRGEPRAPGGELGAIKTGRKTGRNKKGSALILDAFPDEWQSDSP